MQIQKEILARIESNGNVSDPIVIHVGDFDEKGLKSFQDEYNKTLSVGQGVVCVNINSYGGSVHALLSMVNILKHCHLPVITYNSGVAMSCGLILLSCGTKGLRYTNPYSHGLIHEVSSGAYGKLEEIKNTVEHSKKLNEQIFHILAKQAGKRENYFFNLMKKNKNADLYLSPEELVKHGIVDKVSTPALKLTVSQDLKVVELE